MQPDCEYWWSELVGMYLVADKATGELIDKLMTLKWVKAYYPNATLCVEMGE